MLKENRYNPRPLAALLAGACLALIAAAPTPARAQASCAAGTTVTTPKGPICGTASQTTVAGNTYNAVAYRGIRYAQTPSRWNYAAPISASWTTPFPATGYGAICPQPPPGCGTGCPKTSPPQSEDCLFLNLWVPPGTQPGAGLPVMVFIHGGAFFLGSGGAETGAPNLFDGTYLAASGKLIVVSFNYRLGALGFLSLPGFTPAGTPNPGFDDQQKALRWVQANIASFGGNANQVTLFGESAGAMSVGLHSLVAPGSQGLFQQAIMESNPLAFGYRQQADATAVANAFCILLQNNTNCSTDQNGCHPECLSTSQASAAQIASAEGQFSLLTGAPAGPQNLLVWTPMLDGTQITGEPIAAANTLKIPLIMGTNQDEGWAFTPCPSATNPTGVLPPFAYTLAVNDLFPTDASTVTSFSPDGGQTHPYACPSNATDCSSYLAQVMTDYVFSCANRHFAQLASTSSSANAPMWVYLFTEESTFPSWPGMPAKCATEVCHSEELPYVFNTAAGVCPSYSFTAGQEMVAGWIGDYWTRFATTGNPNPKTRSNKPPAAGNPLWWWEFDKTSYVWLEIDENPIVKTDPLNAVAHCSALWDEIGYELLPSTDLLLHRVRKSLLHAQP